MKTYAAEVSTGIVSEVIVGDCVWANENLSGEWVDCTDGGELIAGIGYFYDAVADQFTAPPAPVLPIGE